MDRSSELVYLSLELAQFDLIIDIKFEKLTFWSTKKAVFEPICKGKLLRLKTRFFRCGQNDMIMHLGGLGDSLRPGTPLGTTLKLLDMIWIDFMQNKKNRFFKILGLNRGTVVVCALTLPHGKWYSMKYIFFISFWTQNVILVIKNELLKNDV